MKFKKEYGPAKLRSTFFKYAPLNGETATEVFDRIVLRSGKNRSWATLWNTYAACYTRNQWARDSQISMSGLGSHGTFVHLYLNGLYWGLYNACERPNAWFASAYLGGQQEDWFSVNHEGPFQGDPGHWNYLRGVLSGKDLSESGNNQERRRYLDVEQFADYLILCWYMRLEDWPDNNWYGAHRNNPLSPMLFFIWDAEESWSSAPLPSAWVHPRFRASADTHIPDMVGIWHELRKNEDFMSLFADRVYMHCFQGGALTDANAIARWRILNDYIEDAVVAESARWGDARRQFSESTRTRDTTFYPEVERVVPMMTGNVEAVIRALRSEGYYPEIDPPELEYHSPLLGTATVEIRNPNGDVGSMYYTLNGEDPRAPGGAVATGALEGFRRTTVISKGLDSLQARVKSNGSWSALRQARLPAKELRFGRWRLFPPHR